MESIPSQLSAGRDSNSSPALKQDAQSFSSSNSLKPNQVSETSLYGVPIVSLVIDGQERLCLAQISNTLLKNYSYNEIHNRRVALGITCVQCTPVQLEILRRAGAMPISSRRCGMITKREAERLCKSFLGAHNPPKLPENFAFDVSHECAWGSRGSFIPARYNSSRAKCIKCTFCNMYFSPNKFIFHSHRTPESKYTQPDAANFNSWRRHLKLTDKNSSDDINHAWEDVKAMFNGGSRKRTLPMNGSDMSSPMKSQNSSNHTQRGSPEVGHKSLRCDEDRGTSLSLSTAPRNYPIIPVPSKGFGMLQKRPPPLFPHPYGFPGFGLCQKKDDGLTDSNKANVPAVFWPSAKDSIYPTFPMFWPTAGGLPLPPYQQSAPKPPTELFGVRQNDLEASDQSDRCTTTPNDSYHDSERSPSAQSARNDEDKSGDETGHSFDGPTSKRKLSYISAFRPVVKDAEAIAKLYGNRDTYSGVRSGYLSPDLVSESSSYRSISPDRDSVDDPDVDVESNRGHEDEDPIQMSAECQSSPVLDLAHTESKENRDTAAPSLRPASPEDASAALSDEERTSAQVSENNISTQDEVYTDEKDTHTLGTRFSTESSLFESKHLNCLNESNVQNASPIDVSVHGKDIENMAKEELQKQLVEQVELRKKLEREFQNLKDNFQDQMKRELSYREEMVQQLQIVRDADPPPLYRSLHLQPPSAAALAEGTPRSALFKTAKSRGPPQEFIYVRLPSVSHGLPTYGHAINWST
ncbi:SKI family transcriptional corepressor 1 homolog-B-like isoform X2 [Gadus macrocephalus]|uniref:SKI family transcriptional corepressor 1 homolog-B-like isoform X2 n=1 Tax=Gadus macrocephalus TaxID=80720 RepID=UPI0028CB7605|nr:SKI family transcriptional corepressor 1 homolog-B-like isoform X2 [Gadus macrocephalus]